MKTLLRLVPLAIVAAFGLATVHAAQSDAPAGPLAPEFIGGPWINTKDGKPATLAARKGKLTLVAFWTFGCVNCQNNLKPYARLLAKYRPKGVEMISVHTPELPIEHDVEEVKKHVAKYGIDYPVLVDGDSANWNRWHVRVWPSLGLIDGDGRIVRAWEGELNWQGKDGEGDVARAIDVLLATR